MTLPKTYPERWPEDDETIATIASLRAENERLKTELAMAQPLYSRRQLEAENDRLRAAATNLMAVIDDMHSREKTFTARVSIAASDMKRALTTGHN